MKKALLVVMALALVFVVVGLKCGKDEVTSVTLTPKDTLTKVVSDSVMFEVTTVPAEVDSVLLTDIAKLAALDTALDKYTYKWVLVVADTGMHNITAKAFLGDASLESTDTLKLTVTP